jgi:hypothetical protein
MSAQGLLLYLFFGFEPQLENLLRIVNLTKGRIEWGK